MLYFVDQITVLLPALGVELFAPAILQKRVAADSAKQSEAANTSILLDRTSRKDSIEPTTAATAISVILKDNTFGIEAEGLESNGEILVLEGSKARGQNDSKVNVYSQLRERLVREGKIVATSDPKVMRFTSDVLFNSPSAASAVILDRNDNGRNSWREKTTQRSLNDWYALQANEVRQPSDADLS